MNGDKKVGLCLIGYLGTLPQLNKPVGFAGIDYLHVGTVLLNDAPEGQRIAQRKRLLL